MLRILRKIILVLTTSFFLFPFSFPFLPEALNTKIIVAAFGVLAFVAALLVGVATIAIAWFWYRPLLSIMLVVIALGVAYLLSRMGKAKGPAPAATLAQAQ